MIKEQDSSDKDEKADRPATEEATADDGSKHRLHLPAGSGFDTDRKHRSETNLPAIEAADSLDRRKALSINKDFQTYKYIDQAVAATGQTAWSSNQHQAKSAASPSSKALVLVDSSETATSLKTNWIEKLKVTFSCSLLLLLFSI